MRALYVSSIKVTPGTGGGNATYSLLEPAPAGCEVRYASLSDYPPGREVFPEVAQRSRIFSSAEVLLLPALREGRVRKGLRDLKGALRLKGPVTFLNVRNMRGPVIEWAMEQIAEVRPDVLLLAPQPTLDVVVSNEVLDRTGLPAVVWFMDDYYADRYSRARVKTLWNRAYRRFVISESMGERFSALYGGDYEVLNNSIDYPESYEPPSESPDGRLRVLYAGSVNEYYTPTMEMVLREFRGLGNKAALDIYTGEELPEVDHDDKVWRRFPLIKPEKLISRLREYDVLLLLSNFSREFRTVAETAQASKMADYLAAGRCILAYGPPYADNVRYLERHGIGETVTSPKPSALREAVLALAGEPEHRRRLGERAYHFGREHRDRAKNRERLWRALTEAAGAS